MDKFYEAFSGYVNDEDLQLLGMAEISGFTVIKEKRAVETKLLCNTLVDYSVIDRAQEELRAALRLKRMTFYIKYNKSLFDINEIEKILSPIKYKNSVTNGFFDGAEAELEDGVLTVCLKKGGKEILETQNIDREISRLIYDEFGLDLDVTFLEVKSFDIEKAVQDAVEEKRRLEAEQKKKAETEYAKTLWGNTPLYVETKRVIRGNPIRDIPTPIAELEQRTGYVTVWGDVINTDSHPTRRPDTKILSVDITDYSSSVAIKVYDSSDRVDALEESIKKAKTIVVHGVYKFDGYSNEYVVSGDNVERVIKAEKEDNAEEKRVELHLHTSLSEMDGITAPEKLVKRAADWGHKAIAVTDHGVVQALPEAYAAAKKNGIKLILGMEGYLVDDEKYPEYLTMKKKEIKRHHIILLVKEDTSFDESIPKSERKYGRKNLYEMISFSNVKAFKGRPLIPKSMLAEKRDGILVGSACEQGEIIQAILSGADDEELERLAEFYDYIEVQPIGNNRFMIESERELHSSINSEDDLINLNKKLVALADKLNKPVVATGDVHFLDEKDAKFRAIIQASMGYKDCDNQAPLYFKTTDEMLEDFAWAGDRAKEFVIDNPNKIADMIQDNIPPIPPGTFQPHIDGADEELTKKCWNTAKELYGDPVPEYVAQRLQRELDSIISNGFGVLYVIAKRLVEQSEKLGYSVGSRGSVGSSLVAHFGGISEVNPLAPHYYCKKCKHSEFFLQGEYGSGFDLPAKNCPVCGEPMKRDGHEIPFETFLGFKGDKTPDIDLNFSGDVQSRIHRFTEELFGKEYVFKAGTMATVAEKTAYGFTKKYLDERGLGELTPRAEIERLKVGCTGIKRTTGQHPGGMVVVPDEYTVEDFTPIQYPSNDEDKGTYTTHFDFKHSLHDTLLKLDELGHDNPTLIKYLENLSGVPSDEVDLSDPKIYQLLTSTEPLGVSEEDIGCPTGTLAIPEMGTGFVVNMLVDAQPKTFADLLQISGLSHGTDVWLGNAQDLIKNGTCDISSVIGCRDDIMTHLIHVAEKYERETGEKSPLSKEDCFNIMEITRKGKAPAGLPPYEEAMKKIGVEQWYIDSCYKIKYMFPKAHAAAYVMAALRIAWYKIYYPLEFYSAFFTVRGGAIDAVAAVQGRDAVREKMELINEKDKENQATQKDKSQYTVLQIVNEMLARGYEFLPVDLYKSDWRVYQIEDGKIRLPFLAIDGVGESAAKAIADAVERNPDGFIASDDLANEPGVGKSVVDALRAAGALGDLPETTQITLF